MITEEMKAPWTQEQVNNLMKWQQCEWVHPFTCCSPEQSANCHRANRTGEGILIPTTEGWQCSCGWYKQNWAHQYMLDGNIPPDWREEIKRRAENGTV